MLVAYVGNFRHTHCTEVHVKASLEALGHRVLPLQEDAVSWASLPRLLRQRRAGLLLWTRTWGDRDGKGLRAVEQLRAAGVPTVSFHLDRWWGLEREGQLDTEAFFRTDLVVTPEGDPGLDWAGRGIRHAWLPPGVFHAETGEVEPDRETWPHDVVFVGSHPYPHPGWEPYRTAVVEACARRFGDRFAVWPGAGRGPVRGKALQRLYASAKVAVGDSCLLGEPRRYWSDRIPETLGRGCALVHPWVDGLDELYDIGADLATYSLGDVDGLVARVEMLLDDEVERDAMAANGREATLARDTYVHRMGTVLGWVEELRLGRDPTPWPAEGAPRQPESAPAAAPLRTARPAVAEPHGPAGALAGVISGGAWRAAAGYGEAGMPSGAAGDCGDCGRVAAGDALCAICGAPLSTVLCMGDAPVANALRASADEPVARHAQHLCRCPGCGTVQLASRPPAEALFGADYPYRSGGSRTMAASASLLAQYMVDALDLGKGDLVLEVGSNDGYLLRHYLRLGTRVLGYDPAREAAFDAVDAGVETVVEFFDSKAGEAMRGQAAVVHANNVLAHVDDPADLVAGMAAALRDGGVLALETPWLLPMIDDGAFDTIYHEHRFYWSAHALDRLLAGAGLGVMGVEQHRQLHGGTLRVFASHRERRCVEWMHTLAMERRAGLEDEDWAGRYGRIHAGQVEKLRRWWRGVSPAAGYGAAAKGAVMMHALGPDCRPPLWVVDSTPAKQGKWTPAGSLVLPPGELEGRMPSDCVVFPWNFADEIARRAAGYVERGGRLWTLVPDARRVA